MDYQLAKQLKDSGFPQDGIKEPYCLECKKWKEGYCAAVGHDTEYIKVPTLSELIEACGGNKNFKLTSDFEGNWRAYHYLMAREGKGSTHDEATANLYIVLNKK